MDDLATLLVLLHDAQEPFSSVHARYRIWRHHERAHRAFMAHARRLRGATVVSGSRDGPERPPEAVELVEIWRRAPDRGRVARQGGDRDGSVGVRVGERWWQWDARTGATTNADDLSVGSGVGEELAPLLDPQTLLGPLRFVPAGRSERAGRAVIVADAVARREPRRGRGPGFELHELGAGADRYRLELDAERGIVLAAHAFAGSEPFQIIEALELELDRPIDDERFVFRAPDGEEIRPPGFRGRLIHHASIAEARAAAPFTLLVPARVPSSWSVHCTYSGPSERPPAPASASISYRSDSGHESVSLFEAPAGAMAARMPRDAGEPVRAGPYAARVSARGDGPQSQLQLEHEGTSVLMLSETLSREQLIALAAMLVPAPPASEL